MRVLVLSLILCLYITDILSQANFRFEHFGTDEGLSQNVVYCIQQDKKGFLWIGTHDGLNRYDGYTFTKYYYIPNDTNSLAENIIYNILEDQDGILWITTINYLHRFIPEKNQFERFRIPENPEESPIYFSSTSSDIKAEVILVKTSAGNLLFDKEKKIFYTVMLPNGGTLKNRSTPSSSVIYHDNKIFCIPTLQKGVYRYNVNKKTLQIPEETIFKNLKNEIIISLLITKEYIFAINKEGDLIRSGAEGLIKKNLFAGEITDIIPNSLNQDQKGNIWVLLKNKLLAVDKYFSNLTIINPNFSSNQQFGNTENKCILIDRSGCLWIGTFGNGLHKYNTNQKNISNYVFGGNNNNLPGKFVHSIKETGDGKFIIAFYETSLVALLDLNNSSIKVSDHRKFSFNSAFVKNIYTEEMKSFGHIKLFRDLVSTKKLLIQTNPVFFRDREAGIWIKADNHLQCLTKKLIIETGVYIESVCEDKNGDFWIATSGKGLGHYQKIKNQLRFLESSANWNGPSTNTINSVLYDSSGHSIWLATQNGLNQFDISKEKFYHFSTADGLCHNNIYSLVKDKEGFLWLGTGNGLSRFDPGKKSFRNYNTSDGLINMEFNRNCAISGANGILIFGGTEGIDVFDPLRMNQPSKPPAVQITDVKVFNRSISYFRQVSLSSSENNLQISFAAMDFTNPRKTKYAYRLKGIEKDWTYTEGKNSVSFASLKPGKYTFVVKASNEAGIWNENPASFSFAIHPPWWKSWWFYLLAFSGISSIVYLLFRYRLKKKLEVIQLRNRIHRDLHDDVGATLSTIKAYTEMLKVSPGKKEFLELIDENAGEMLEKLDVITWANNPEKDNFGSLIEKIKLFATPIFYHKGIDLIVQSDSSLTAVDLPGTVRQNLFLICKEASNNAAKYSNASVFKIKVHKDLSSIRLLIEDDGIGFSENVKKGYGLGNIKRRTSELGGTCQINSRQGTHIEINIPYPFK